MDNPIRIEPATAADIPLIHKFIKELAEYERMSEQCVATEALLREALFGEKKFAEVVVAYITMNPPALHSSFITSPHFLPAPEFISKIFMSFRICAARELEKRSLFIWLRSRRKETAADLNGPYWIGMNPLSHSIKNWGQFHSTTGQYSA